MSSNGIFDFSIPPVPSDALRLGTGSYTFNTNSDRYAYAPFRYKKGEGKANDFIQIYIVNSASEYKIVKWKIAFKDSGKYNPGQRIKKGINPLFLFHLIE